MKNNIIKTPNPVDNKDEKTPKKKNFRFLKFRRARPEKKKNKPVIEEKKTLSGKMFRDRHGIPDSEDISFEEWMSLAKRYAKRYHKITFPDKHGFWKTVASHWYLKSSPCFGVKDAIIIWDLNSSR